MYGNNAKVYNENSQEEFSFPNLPPLSVCRENIGIIKSKAFPYKIVCYATLIMSVLFGILAFVLWFKELLNTDTYDVELGKWITYQPDYSNAIMCGILFIITAIPCIVSLIFVTKYTKQINFYKRSIKINNQYLNFIYQGYDKKEAYRLTLEWLDRQDQTQALNNVANATSSVAYMATMSHINHINRR